MSNIAIEVNDLCIRYKKTKRFSIKSNFFSLKKNNDMMFEALKHVSFKVEKGTILGVVGKNGSGKSTLLKAIASIFSPDIGNIDLKGNSVSLLAIGIGFQKELSGRENILLSGMLLGFSRKKVMEKEQAIVDFSELGDFIDEPVKTYSSGMYSKLAFSITAILETDIMLIDEVLSVGDAGFKKKSYSRMKSLITNKDRTVIIVSHVISKLEKLCDEIMWLHDGEIKMYGGAEEVLSCYNDFMGDGGK